MHGDERIDLEKLTAFPWDSVRGQQAGSSPPAAYFLMRGPRVVVAKFKTEEDCDFAAMASKACEVMVRRGWTVKSWIPGSQDGKAKRRFGVVDENWFWIHGDDYWRQSRHDPFTALVEADKWYRDNVEQKIG